MRTFIGLLQKFYEPVVGFVFLTFWAIPVVGLNSPYSADGTNLSGPKVSHWVPNIYNQDDQQDDQIERRRAQSNSQTLTPLIAIVSNQKIPLGLENTTAEIAWAKPTE